MSTSSSTESTFRIRLCEVDISMSRAQKLLAGAGSGDCPSPGRERMLAHAEQPFSHPRAELWLGNHGGQLRLSSPTIEVLRWGEVFGPSYATFSKMAADQRAQNERAVFLAKLSHFFASDGKEPSPAELEKLLPAREPNEPGRTDDEIHSLAMQYGQQSKLDRYIPGFPAAVQSDGPFYVMVDHETSVGLFATLEEAREAGQEAADNEPLPSTFTITNIAGEILEEIVRSDKKGLADQMREFDEHHLVKPASPSPRG